MNRVDRPVRPCLRATVASVVAAALVCAIVGAAAAGVGSAVRQPSPHRSRTLDWLASLPDDLPGAGVPVAGAAVVLAGEALTPAAVRPRHNDTAVLTDRPAPSHVTRISLPPPALVAL